MNWEVFGAISEFVGAVGVIASLVYVAEQMKQGNVASRVDAKLRLVEKMADFQDMLIASQHLNNIIITGRKGIDGLSKQDYLEFSNLALKATWFMSAMYFMHQNKTISDDDWHENYAIVRYWTSSKGFRQWWRKLGNRNFTGPFKRFVELEIGKNCQNNEST